MFKIMSLKKYEEDLDKAKTEATKFYDVKLQMVLDNESSLISCALKDGESKGYKRGRYDALEYLRLTEEGKWHKKCKRQAEHIYYLERKNKELVKKLRLLEKEFMDADC